MSMDDLVSLSTLYRFEYGEQNSQGEASMAVGQDESEGSDS